MCPAGHAIEKGMQYTAVTSKGFMILKENWNKTNSRIFLH